MIFQKQMRQQNAKLYIFAFAVLFLDQIVKFISLKEICNIGIYKNYSSLLGLSSDSYFLFFFFLLLIFYLKKEIFIKSDKIGKLAFLLMLGGIFSNFLDMFFYGYIIDYITFENLFSFNIADLAISIGSFLLGWKIFRK